MKTIDAQSLARAVVEARTLRGLSQADLADAAKVSAKTVQRLEAGESLSGGSRRAILTVLDLELESFAIEEASSGEPPGAPTCRHDGGPRWLMLDESASLLDLLASAREVQVELEDDGGKKSLQSEPWYKRKMVLAIGDPMHALLEKIDVLGNGRSPSDRPAPQEALELSRLFQAVQAMGWRAAARSGDRTAELQLFLGSNAAVQERCTHEESPGRS